VYFHQGYDLEFSDREAVEAVVAAFARNEEPRVVADLISEIDAALQLPMGEADLGDLWIEELGAAYDPTVDGATNREWFAHVRELLLAEVSMRGRGEAAGLSTRWHYFLSTSPGDSPEAVERGEAGITRLPEGWAVSVAEAVWPNGQWMPTDSMWREKFLGSGSSEFVEISPARAQELLRRWVEIGRLTAMPSEESMMTADLVAHLEGREREDEARWRGVPKPPGSQDVGQ
jgi:hypothetical protein